MRKVGADLPVGASLTGFDSRRDRWTHSPPSHPRTPPLLENGIAMGIGLSILLLAAGAVLAFAVNTTTWNGIDVHAVGLIVMAAGALGLVWSLIVMFGRRRGSRPRTAARGRHPRGRA